MSLYLYVSLTYYGTSFLTNKAIKKECPLGILFLCNIVWYKNLHKKA